MTTTTRTLPVAFRRLRRLRRSQALRDLVRETRLSPQSFVYPLFVTHGDNVRRKIDSMPGQYQLSLDQLLVEAEELRSLGIPAVLLFGLPASKDDAGSEAYDPEGSVLLRNLAALLGDDVECLRRPLVACIGPITADTARELGLRVDVEAEEHTVPGLVRAVRESCEGDVRS